MTRRFFTFSLPTVAYTAFAVAVAIAVTIACFALAAPEENRAGIVSLQVPPGRRVIIERRKTDLSRNLPITVNQGDLVLKNGVLCKEPIC